MDQPLYRGGHLRQLHSPGFIRKAGYSGAENSYRQASKNLGAESGSKRSVNSIESLRKSAKKVARVVGDNKLKPVTAMPESTAAEELIAVIDGGHLKAKDKDVRSFEAMTGTVYRPENIRLVDNHHNEIT